MGFRFRKRFRIIPGLALNVSKTGASLSIGGHGLTANLSRQGVQETVGLPGSGVSYRTRRRRGTSHRSSGRRAIPQAPRRGLWTWLLGL